MLSTPGHAERKLAPAVRQSQVDSFKSQAAKRKATDHARDAALFEHRSRIEDTYTVPTIAIPSHWQTVRFHGLCPYAHCGGSAFEMDLPPVNRDRSHPSYRGTVLCLLCSRVVAQLKIGDDDERTPAEVFHALPPHLKPCPDCGIHTTRSKNARCRECWKSAKAGGQQR